jgi:hypothetical protein
LVAAGLTLAVVPAFAGFLGSGLTPGQTSDPRLYDINAVTITQNSSAVLAVGSVACAENAAPFSTTENSYYRRFDLNGAHGIVTPFSVTQVDFGVELAETSTGGPFVVTVRLHTIPNAAALTTANMTLIGTANVNVPDGTSLVIFQVPIAAAVAAPLLDDLVVEILTPDGRPTDQRLFIGSNSAGQTAPSFIRAPDCGIAQPTNLAGIGFPGMHVYMAVTGNEAGTPVAGSSWGRVKTLYR